MLNSKINIYHMERCMAPGHVSKFSVACILKGMIQSSRYMSRGSGGIWGDLGGGGGGGSGGDL